MGGGGLVPAAGPLSTQTEPDAGTAPTSGPLGTLASFPFLKLSHQAVKFSLGLCTALVILTSSQQSAGKRRHQDQGLKNLQEPKGFVVVEFSGTREEKVK